MDLGDLEQRMTWAAGAVFARVTRLYEGLHHLAAVTRVLVESPPPSREEIEAWASASLAVDDDGYLARPRVLARARAGDPDPDTFVYYVHARHRTDLDVLRRMYQLRELGAVLRPLRDRIGGLEWVYFQDPRNWALSFPSHDPSKAIPADFDWLSYLTYVSVEPTANPDRRIRWTPPNIDYGNRGLMVAASVPIYGRDDAFLGVWSIDVPVRSLLAEARAGLEMAGDAFFVDDGGYLVAHDRIEAVIAPEKGAAYRARWSTLGGDYARLDAAALAKKESGGLELVDGQGQRLVCRHRTLPELGWMMWVAVPAAELLQTQRRAFREAFERVGKGDFAVRLDAAPQGELHALVEGFNGMAEQLQRLIEEQAEAQQHWNKAQRIQTLGQLASGVAHDFNNLLTVILSYADLLVEEEPDPERRQMSAAIREAAERASTLTTQLLAFSRHRALTRVPLDVADVLERASRMVQRLLPESVELELDVARALPAVVADESQLVQVFMNLVVNARDAMPQGGAVRVQVFARGQDIAWVVEDEGDGVAPELRSRVFEPFFTTKTTGTGLGLAAVRDIIEGMGGTIRLGDAAQGARFEIELPGQRGGTAARVDADDRPARLDGCRILVLDDDALVRRSARTALERHGATVVDHGAPEVILEHLAQGGWDALVTDVRMPRLSGPEVAERARRTCPGLAVLLMSGYAEESLTEAQAVGTARIAKPFTGADLSRALRRLLSTG